MRKLIWVCIVRTCEKIRFHTLWLTCYFCLRKYPGWAGLDFNPNKPNGFSHPNTLGESICHLRGHVYIFHFCSICNWKSCKRKWRTWTDAAFCSAWSGSALFAYVPQKGRQAYLGYVHALIFAIYTWPFSPKWRFSTKKVSQRTT